LPHYATSVLSVSCFALLCALGWLSKEARAEQQQLKPCNPSTAVMADLQLRHLADMHLDDEDENEDVCRICRCPGEADNALFYPCK
jgi:E3 ubiquitin-protein ligase MARCH6